MNRKTEILIIAGELSGDMHAAALVRALRARCPGLKAYGIGGDAMRDAGVEIKYHVRDMAVMGFSEVLLRFRFFARVFKETLRLASERKPDAVILVDYPGFNLRFAARAHALGIKTIYYICPQVWAWNRARIPRMASVLDRLVTIFPFEKEHFEGTNLRVDFAGHPLAAECRAALDAPCESLPWKGEPRVALLPGSRPHEVDRILPVLWRAAGHISVERPDASFLVAAPSQEIAARAAKIVAATSAGPGNWDIVTGRTRQVLRQARAAIVASGTATVETALMRCPMTIVYRMAALTYAMGRMLVKVDHIGMVNIIAGKRVCPEFVQRDARPRAVARALLPLLDDTPERAAMLGELADVARGLDGGGAAERAADAVLDELTNAPR